MPPDSITKDADELISLKWTKIQEGIFLVELEYLGCKYSIKYRFFWKRNESHGFCANWYYSPFKSEGKLFYTLEQYIMWRKGTLFQDTVSATKILGVTDGNGAECKKLGRLVTGFDQKIWDNMSDSIVKEGLRLKFGQNPDLKEKLLSTGLDHLVEASPYDKIWGIGLSYSDAIKMNPHKWPGKNKLGLCLEEVREEFSNIREEFSNI